MSNARNISRRWVGRQRRSFCFRRPAVFGMAVMLPAWMMLLAGTAVVLAADSQQPQRAAPSPSDKPPAPPPPATAQQATPPQPAVAAGGCVPASSHVVYEYRRRRVRSRTWCYPVPSGSAATQPSAPPAAAAKPQPSAKSKSLEKPAAYAWRNLFDGKTLNGWKSAEFGGEGKVYVENGMIVMDLGNSMTGITYTGEVPRDNYEISLEGMRLEGSDFFCTTTFPVGKDCCSLVMGGWGGTVVGLSTVDYYDASENSTTTFQSFKDNQWYHVRIRVTPARIQAWVDDEEVVDQERPDHKIGIRMEVDLCQPLGVATWCTKGAVRNIRIRQLRPEAAPAEESKE